DMLRPELARMPSIVYEFDSPDLRTGYMYPAMARTFRAVGAQFAAIFAYDMLQTASRNLGWQTPYLNLVYTPPKPMSDRVAGEALPYAGSAQAARVDRGALGRMAGCGSSPVVSYEGGGIYFLDKVRPGVWRLEVYPDAVPVRDAFEPPSRDKLVTRAISRSWHMTVRLPDLGGEFTVQAMNGGGQPVARAEGCRFAVILCV